MLAKKILYASPDSNPYRKNWIRVSKNAQSFELPPVFRPETAIGIQKLDSPTSDSLSSVGQLPSSRQFNLSEAEGISQVSTGKSSVDLTIVQRKQK